MLLRNKTHRNISIIFFSLFYLFIFKLEFMWYLFKIKDKQVDNKLNGKLQVLGFRKYQFLNWTSTMIFHKIT